MNEPEAPVEAQEPRRITSPLPLEPEERRRVWWAALLPFPAVALFLLPFAIVGTATVGSVVGGALVYGGLLSLATGFVAVDRQQHHQCPACRARNPRRTPACGACGYDLVGRPRFACPDRHRIHLDPGLCDCGRRLQSLPGGGGIGREVVVILRIGAWMLAFLVGMGLLFRFLG